MLATSRVQIYRQTNRGVQNTGWQLVQYPGHGEMWEPEDTIFARGANGPEKIITAIRIAQDNECVAPTPLAGSVLYPRTGTAA